MIGPLKDRIRSRRTTADGEEGYVTMMALGLIVLVLATSGVLLMSATNSTNAARSSRANLEGRQGCAAGFSVALAELNSGSTATSGNVDLSARTAGNDPAATPSTIRWRLVDGNVVVTCGVRGAKQKTPRVLTAPLLQRQVDTGKEITDGDGGTTIIYTADPAGRGGIWASAGIASVKNSTYGGKLYEGEAAAGAETPGRWEVYGPSAIRVAAGSTILSAAFSDNVRIVDTNGDAVAGAPGVPRADLSLGFGGNRIIADARKNRDTQAQGADEGYDPNSTKHLIIAEGDLTISGDISRVGDVRIYATGDVNFTKGPGLSSTRDLKRVFVYAPYGTCSAENGLSLRMTGSLACKIVDLPGNEHVIRHVSPSEGTFVSTTKTVFYLGTQSLKDTP